MSKHSKRNKNFNFKPTPVPSQNTNLSAAFRSLTYSGPIPLASEMEKYEALCPGATDRILKIAEKSLKLTAQQSEHRQKLEAEALKSSSRVSLIGEISAALIALTSLILTGFCVYMGHEIIGTILSGSTIASIISAFIYGTSSNRQEREAKWQKALEMQQKFKI